MMFACNPRQAFLGLSLLMASVAPLHAEQLTLVLPAAVQTLDPHMSSAVSTDLSLAEHVYSTLVFRNTAGELTGDLAESWKAVDDKTWEFKLRPGITFPDGEPLDAAAVKWNIERIMNPATQSRNRTLYAQISKVDVIDASTVHVVTAEPFPVLPAQMTMLFLMPPKWTQTHNPAVEASGTGPYEIVSYRSGDRIVLKARPGYYGNKPVFDDVTLRMIPENSVRVAALRAGEVDFARNIAPTDVEQIKAGGKATGGWTPSIRTMVVKMDTTKPPFNNKMLREAVNYAIDRDAIIKGFYNGWSQVASCQILTDRYFGYNSDLKPVKYDPEKAMDLIAKSGVSNPTAVFEVPVGQYLLGTEIAQIIAAQLQAVGFNIQFKESEYASWITRYTNNGIAPLTFMGHAWPTMDADGQLQLYAGDNKAGYWHDKTYDDALKAARSIVDPAERLKQYKIATQEMCSEAPTAALFSQPTIFGHSLRVKWSPRPDDWTLATDFTLAK
jgi:peptide/nickel transport system substrate-binding protein